MVLSSEAINSKLNNCIFFFFCLHILFWPDDHNQIYYIHLENYNNEWDPYGIRKCATSTSALIRWKEEGQNLYVHKWERTLGDRIGTFCPTCGAHFASPQAAGFIIIYLITFIYLKATPLPRCFPWHPDYELDSNLQSSCSISKWNSENTMQCKLIKYFC